MVQDPGFRVVNPFPKSRSHDGGHCPRYERKRARHGASGKHPVEQERAADPERHLHCHRNGDEVRGRHDGVPETHVRDERGVVVEPDELFDAKDRLEPFETQPHGGDDRYERHTDRQAHGRRQEQIAAQPVSSAISHGSSMKRSICLAARDIASSGDRILATMALSSGCRIWDIMK